MRSMGRKGVVFPCGASMTSVMWAELNFGGRMFKFLFEKVGGKAKIETQCDTVVRTVEELNSVLALI